MVTILEKSEHNVNFHPIVDFIEASPLRYALTFKPTVYVSHIRQFWSTARIETMKEGTKILATVDGILRTVTESSLRRNLKLKDEEGISSLPDAELFEDLTLMGYNISPNQKFTFQKGQFSHQWKYLIHTIMQCLSPKSTGFNEFSSNIAAALVCLATNRTYNFSKMIFDGMVKNVNNKVSKFLMYPRFLTMCLRMGQFGQITHTHTYVVPFHTQKLFTTLRVNSLSFLGRIVPLFDIMLVPQGEGSGTPTEPYHTPSPEAQHTSYTTHSSLTLPPVTTAPIPTVTPSDTPPLRQYTRRSRIAQSSALPPVIDEPTSPLRDVSEGAACPTDSDFGADQDRENIAKTSTLPHDSAPWVTSPAADEGSMQLKLDELTGLCTSLQRQHSEMVAKFEAQELEINRLKARVKLLEDRKGVAADKSGDDAPIKGRNLDEGEAAAKRVSDDTEEMATVLTSIDAATVLASGVTEVPTGSGSIPTAGPPAAEVPTSSDVVPTAGLIFATATVVTPYIRRKGKETMVESETLKKKKIQEQMDIQMARQLEEETERDAQRMNGHIAKDAEIARIHAEEELQIMINRLDRSNETIAKYLQEYHQFATELPLERRIELISDLVRGMTFKEIEAKFTTVWKQLEDFIPIGSKEEAERFKRKGIREDLNQLWALVKESLSIRQPTRDKEMELWVELKRLYKPDDEDQLWTHTQNLMHAPVEWKLYDMCGVHQGRIFGNKMHKVFPLPVIEFPLPEEVSTASEESCHCQKKREATAVKIALLLKSRRNCQSKSDDSYAKLVPHVTPCILGITIIVTSCTRTPSPIKGVR
nr:hypothetical protein [Tanacetum cinerariifolium]